ncbi:MAG: hypothetical protein IJ507_00675, partial [Clostridia bacterium]|nr:hypothetical protein [Clostridia bacterium]
MKKFLATLMALVLLLSCCGIAGAETTQLTKVRLFAANAMSGSGVMTGAYGEVFARHGLEVEVVAYSPEKLQGMLASGDLADVIWLEQKEMLTAADSGLIINLDDHLDKLPNMMANPKFEPTLNYARQFNSNGTGNLYYIGTVGGSSMVLAPDTDRNAIKMNWPIYKAAGYPEFSKLEDVIPVLKKMQETQPTTAEGVPTYGMHLFSDFYTTYFWNMNAIYTILGKDFTFLPYGIEFDPVTDTGVSIFTEGSVYYRGLKFMYEMNKAGLIDPDSMSQTRSTAKAKIESGAALAGWAGNPGWEAQGYYPVIFDDFTPYMSFAANYSTGGYCIAANTENLDAALTLLDIFCSEDDCMDMRNGLKGTSWDVDENGKPYITEEYFAFLKSGADKFVPSNGAPTSEYLGFSGGLFGTGYLLKDSGIGLCIADFPDMLAYRYSSEIALDWAEHYGYPYLRALMDARNQPTAIQHESFTAFLTPDDDDMIMTKAALKDVIVPASWQMIYAKDEAEFDKIWADT